VSALLDHRSNTAYDTATVPARALEERGFEAVWAPEHPNILLLHKMPLPGGSDLPRRGKIAPMGAGGLSTGGMGIGLGGSSIGAGCCGSGRTGGLPGGFGFPGCPPMLSSIAVFAFA